LGAALSAAGASVTASLDRDSITLGETATLQVVFDNGSPRTVPSIPAITGLQIGYVGPSTQVNMINGQISQRVTLNYQINPKRAGEFEIPALTVEVDGQKVS